MTTTIKKVTLKSLGKNKDIDPSKGTVVNPFTQEEYDSQCHTGEWTGGYVEAMGYVAPPMMDGMGDGSGSDDGLDNTIRDKIVECANKYIGIKEGTDKGNEQIIKWLKSVGLTDAKVENNGNVTYRWCASFASAMYKEAGVDGANSPRVSDWASWGKSIKQPRKADIGIFQSQGQNNISHCVIVVNATKEDVECIYGNSAALEVAKAILDYSYFQDFRTK